MRTVPRSISCAQNKQHDRRCFSDIPGVKWSWKSESHQDLIEATPEISVRSSYPRQARRVYLKVGGSPKGVLFKLEFCFLLLKNPENGGQQKDTPNWTKPAVTDPLAG